MDPSFNRIPIEPEDVFAAGWRIEQVPVQAFHYSVYILRRVDPAEVMTAPNYRPSFYTGMTYQPRKRLAEHNAGKCRATRGKRWCLYWGVTGLTTREARALEVWFKTGDTLRKRGHLADYCMRNRVEFANWECYKVHLHREIGFTRWFNVTYPEIQARRSWQPPKELLP